jgi:hypothetical protein
VAAYDLLNEPFGDGHTADHLPALSDLMGRLYREVREHRRSGTSSSSRAPGRGSNTTARPADRGWTNVAFTEHYYPGLFGDGSHARDARPLHRPADSRSGPPASAQQVPLLVGEFNVVFQNLRRPR